MKKMTRNTEGTGAETMELVSAYYRDEFMQISVRMKAFRFHEAALRKELFYDKRDALTSAYRLDHGFDDLFLEAKKIAKLIVCLNTDAKHDPYIGRPFLGRMYQVKTMPDPKSASNDDIAAHFRDVFELLDDYEELVYKAREEKESAKPQRDEMRIEK